MSQGCEDGQFSRKAAFEKQTQGKWTHRSIDKDNNRFKVRMSNRPKDAWLGCRWSLRFHFWKHSRPVQLSFILKMKRKINEKGYPGSLRVSTGLGNMLVSSLLQACFLQPNYQQLLCSTLILLLLIYCVSCEVCFLFLTPISLLTYGCSPHWPFPHSDTLFPWLRYSSKKPCHRKRTAWRNTLPSNSHWHLFSTVLSVFWAWLDCKALFNYWIKKVNANSPWVHN